MTTPIPSVFTCPACGASWRPRVAQPKWCIMPGCRARFDYATGQPVPIRPTTTVQP